MAKETFSVQSLVPIQEIKRGVVVLKNGSLRSVLEVSGINMNLKSLEEQEIILTSWRQILNHLEFSLQTIIHSRRVNIESYLTYIQERINQETNDLLKLQGEDYYNFLTSLTSQNLIFDKKFFIVIPYDPVMIKPTNLLGQLKETFSGIFNLKRESFSNVTLLSKEEFEQHYQQLMIRQANIVSGLTRLGLVSIPLETNELIQLFFNLYNPQNVEKESLNLNESNSQK